jgi:hypothetical protein
MNTTTFRVTMTMLLAGLVAISVGAAAIIQPARGLAALTVPEDRLPPSCRFRPVVPRPIGAQPGVVVIAGNSEPNPLISRDRQVAADIRRMVDGAPREPDGPPLMPRGAAAWAS